MRKIFLFSVFIFVGILNNTFLSVADNQNVNNDLLDQTIQSLSNMKIPDLSGIDPKTVREAFLPLFPNGLINPEKWSAFQKKLADMSHGNITIKACTKGEYKTLCKDGPAIKTPTIRFILENKKTSEKIVFAWADSTGQIYANQDTPREKLSLTKNEQKNENCKYVVYSNNLGRFVAPDKQYTAVKHYFVPRSPVDNASEACLKRLKDYRNISSTCAGMIMCEGFQKPRITVCENSREFGELGTVGVTKCPPATECLNEKNGSIATQISNDESIKDYGGPVMLSYKNKKNSGIAVAYSSKTLPNGKIESTWLASVVANETEMRDLSFKSMADDKCIENNTLSEIQIQPHYRTLPKGSTGTPEGAEQNESGAGDAR